MEMSDVRCSSATVDKGTLEDYLAWHTPVISRRCCHAASDGLLLAGKRLNDCMKVIKTLRELKNGSHGLVQVRQQRGRHVIVAFPGEARNL